MPPALSLVEISATTIVDKEASSNSNTKAIGASSLTYSEKIALSPKMFDNEFIDRFTRVSPMQVYAIYIPLITTLTYYGSIGIENDRYIYNSIIITSAIWWIAGLFIWTFCEYWLHRSVFHFDADYEWAHKLHFIIHGVHHDHPNDKSRLMMPPAASLIISSPFIYTLYYLFPTGAGIVAGSGWLFGYLAYDSLHYHFHSNKSYCFIDQYLRRYHMLHHFQNHDAGFGVSSPLWDWVFRTTLKQA